MLPTRKEYAHHHFRWNFIVNLAESSVCMFGYGFVSFQTFFPVFVSLFTESRVLIGMAGASIPVGWLLPQLFVAPWIESLDRKKPVVVRLAVLEKILYLVLAGLAFVSFQLSSGLLVVLFVGVCFLIGLAGGVTRVGWSELMATIFPPATRGQYFGTVSFAGGLLRALGAYLGGVILSRYRVPHNYALTFFIGFCVIMFSWTFLLWIREPPPFNTASKRVSRHNFLRGLSGLLKQNRDFAFFILSQSVVVLGGMALPFVAVAGRERFDLSGYQIGLLTTSLLLGHTLPSPAVGWLGDHLSHRKALIASIGCQILGFVLFVMSTNVLFLNLAVFGIGAGQGSMWVNVQPLVYDYASLERRPTYIGLSSTAFGVFTVITPLLGGLVAQVFSYAVLFVLSALFSVVALLLYLMIVKEPSIAVEKFT